MSAISGNSNSEASSDSGSDTSSNLMPLTEIAANSTLIRTVSALAKLDCSSQQVLPSPPEKIPYNLVNALYQKNRTN
tara:strand:+ start:409 stop:639 length:231 start_codon:yes stop_codon:yes gene_type:complete